MSRKQKTTKKLSLLIIYSILTSLVTMFFGGPFLRVLRKTYGPVFYWLFFLVILAVAISAKTYLMLLFIGSLWFMVGISVELENLKLPFSWNVLASSVLGTVVSLLGYGVVLNNQGISNLERFKDYFKESLEKVIRSTAENQIDIEALMYQIPSVVLLLFLASVIVSFVFERRIYFWMKLPNLTKKDQVKLIDYKASEPTIWFALVALLLSVLDLKIFNLEDLRWLQLLGSNFVNVLVVVFFFQGFAILEVFLRKSQASVFFRAFTYFIFIGQLFLVLSFIGFVDFWVDFRSRLNKASWLKNESI